MSVDDFMRCRRKVIFAPCRVIALALSQLAGVAEMARARMV
jgi:hypothetical protein